MQNRFLVKNDDPFLDKLLKYIPAEVVAAFVGINGALTAAYGKTASDENEMLCMLLWIVFAILFIVTPLYRWRVTKVTNILQLLVTTLSFAVWVFALGGPFVFLEWYNPVLPAVILPIYILIIPIIFGGEQLPNNK